MKKEPKGYATYIGLLLDVKPKWMRGQKVFWGISQW